MAEQKTVKSPYSFIILLVLSLVVLFSAYNYAVFMGQLTTLETKLEQIDSQHQVLINILEIESQLGEGTVIESFDGELWEEE